MRSCIVISAMLALTVGCTRGENPRVVFFKIAGFDLPKNAKVGEFTDTHGGDGPLTLMVGAGAFDGTLVISAEIEANDFADILNSRTWDETFSNSVIDKSRLALAFLTKKQSLLVPGFAVPHIFRERESSNGTFSNGDLLIVDQANRRIVLVRWDS